MKLRKGCYYWIIEDRGLLSHNPNPIIAKFSGVDERWGDIWWKCGDEEEISALEVLGKVRGPRKTKAPL